MNALEIFLWVSIWIFALSERDLLLLRFSPAGPINVKKCLVFHTLIECFIHVCIKLLFIVRVAGLVTQHFAIDILAHVSIS